MKFINKTLLLFIVIILEGYVVLSAEMLAIRQTLPFIGGGTDTVSIIIAAVLMPLAFGYYAGGRFTAGRNASRHSIREKLIFNIIAAQAIFLIGLSYYPLSFFFYSLIDMGIDHRLVLTTLYSLIFLVTPVYLLGQTIPLVSNYFSKEKLSKVTGRMLFLSTLGSFLGAVFSTLVLMAFAGVNYTTAILSAILALLAVLLSKKPSSRPAMLSIFLTIFAFYINSGAVMKSFNIVENNLYNTVAVFEDGAKNRHMVLNNTASSMYNDLGGKHAYIKFIERTILEGIRNGQEPREILVIGAGAFTFGFEDHFNKYDFVDLDKSLKKISEDYILRSKLTENKHFHPLEARAFLAGSKKKYDLILLDAYTGDLTIPEYLVTREFYIQVKDHLKDNGVVVSNFIVSPNFQNKFSRHVDNTFRSVFPHVSRHVMDDDYRPWNSDPDYIKNVIYIYSNTPDADSQAIYSDNKNRIFYDKPQRH